MIFRRFLSTVIKGQLFYSSRVAFRPRLVPVCSRIPLSTSLMTKPTLGPDAEVPITNIRNPFKNDKGEVLQVKLTTRAADKLNDIKKTDANPELVLRIEVESGGCHGFQYLFSLKSRQDIDENDSVFELNGAEVVIDNVSLGFLRDSTVDYTTELIGSQFKIVNSPYTTSSCGCGASFDFDPTGKGPK